MEMRTCADPGTSCDRRKFHVDGRTFLLLLRFLLFNPDTLHRVRSLELRRVSESAPRSTAKHVSKIRFRSRAEVHVNVELAFCSFSSPPHPFIWPCASHRVRSLELRLRRNYRPEISPAHRPVKHDPPCVRFQNQAEERASEISRGLRSTARRENVSSRNGGTTTGGKRQSYRRTDITRRTSSLISLRSLSDNDA